MSVAMTLSQPEHLSNGGRLVSTDGRTLPLTATALAVDARCGIARVVLEQRFENPYDEPLTVTYSLPMPAEGAVSGFEFELLGKRVVGEVDRKKTARERYEAALMEGRSAAILEQDRSTLFTQEVGNIPPRSEVVARITVDQKLRWLDEGAWEWRFPTVVAPRYMGAEGRVPDAARVSQDVSDAPIAVRTQLSMAVRDELPAGQCPGSPSHALRVSTFADGARLAFADDSGARLDRDIVVRWTVASQKPGLALDVGRPSEKRAIHAHSFGLLTVVPPARASKTASTPVARDLIVLLDTSGSMGGEPLDQARRVVSAMIDTLSARDQLEMIEFGNSPRRWRAGPTVADEQGKRDALAWLAKLRASGGTEMRSGILEALRGLRPEAQRQIVLVTDGLIGFESEVVRAVCEGLPKNSRLHTVGVGSGVNRSLTGPAARAGHGVEVIIGIGEDPERAAKTLVKRTDAPLLVELELSGSALVESAPRAINDMFAASPTLVSVKLRPEGGELVVRGRTGEGRFEDRIKVPALSPGDGAQQLAALFAREAVEDLETQLAAGAFHSDVDGRVETLGLEFQIATRLTSWVAISNDVTVDPLAASRRERMPHELPHGMSAEGLGLRPAGAAPMQGAAASTTEAGESSVLFSLTTMDALEADDEMPVMREQTRTGVAKMKKEVGTTRAITPPSAVARPPARSVGPMGPPPAKPSMPKAPPPPPAPAPESRARRAAPVKDAEGGAGAIGGKGAGDASKQRADAPADRGPSTGEGAGSGVARGGRAASGGESDKRATRQKSLIGSVRDFFFGESEEERNEPEKADLARPAEPVEVREEAEADAKTRAPALERTLEAKPEPQPVVEPAKPSLPTVTVRGRVALTKGRDLIIELTAGPGDLEWDPDGEVTIEFADGTTETLRADTTRSTRATRLRPGQTARLALVLAGDATKRGAVRRIVLRNARGTVIIQL